ncbi:hypothetical protein Hanom_Chr08g00714711 [Helianthus anomalus]
MSWRVMVPMEKVKDIAPHIDEYKENALFKILCVHPYECIVIPKGALVLIGISQTWKSNQLYPGFRSTDRGKHLLY